MERQVRRAFEGGQFQIEKREAEAGTNPIIVGYAAVFDQRTDLGFFTESIAPGAFTESLSRGDDVRALIDHDPSKIIGRTPKTLRLEEDSRGLRYEVTPPETAIARDLITNIAAGLITQSSFGFYIEEEVLNKTGDKPHFTITRARLFDVSPVTFPAYEGTSVSLQRDQEGAAEQLSKRIAAAEGAPATDSEAEHEHRRRFISMLKLSA